MKKLYALYKGERLLIIGTLDEIAENQKVKKKTISYYGSPAHLRRTSKSHIGNYKILVRLDDDCYEDNE